MSKYNMSIWRMTQKRYYCTSNLIHKSKKQNETCNWLQPVMLAVSTVWIITSASSGGSSGFTAICLSVSIVTEKVEGILTKFEEYVDYG